MSDSAATATSPGLLVPAGVIVLGVVVLVVTQRMLLRRAGLSSEERLPRQLLMLLLTVLFAVAVVLVLPVPDSTRNQLLAVLGLALTGAVAFSSTTFVGNIMAGLMLRSVRSFRPGDFIRVGEQFGRVTERGLFHTEIQTEARDLTTLPNLYLVTHPVTVVRQSGTIVTAEVSLGSDIPQAQVEPLLLHAAGQAGLREPYVHVLDLGNFSVHYRVAGFLEDVKRLLSVRSALRMQMLAVLHGAGLEIASPTLMTQRVVDATTRFAPPVPDSPAPAPAAAEDLAFDKADEAEAVERLRARRDALVKRIEAEQDGATRDRLRRDLEVLEHRLAERSQRLEGDAEQD